MSWPARAASSHNRDAIAHLFKVAAGIDSMVLGEPQILGQVKLSYTIAAQSGTCGPILSRLFHRAFRAAKRSAISRPIPLAAPVTSTTRFSNIRLR